MKKALWLVAALLLGGCATTSKDIDRALMQDEHIHLSVAKIDKVFIQKRSKRDIFERFPFLAGVQDEVRGKFSDSFYESLNLVYNAADIKEVNFWRLQKNPKMVDFIYVRPLWIKEYRKVGNDLFENIAYSYNISKGEQQILKEWIKQGGKLWIEFGTYSTKYDVFNRYGEISTKRIAKLIRQSFLGVKLFHKEVKSFIFRSKNLDPINYLPSSQSFTIDRRKSLFKDIKRLKLNLNNYMENYIVAQGKALVVDRKGRVLVSEIEYGKGSVVTLLPFEFSDVYYDGERLRWELLFYLYNKR